MTVTVQHGKLSVKIPRKVYRGYRGEVNDEEWKRFVETLMDKYPWLTPNACKVILENGRKEYILTVDEEMYGIPKALEMESEGNPEGAIAHLKRHIEKNPASERAWYVLGEILCRCGRVEEGYAALAKGRSL